MQFTNEVIIDLPRERVVELFTDTEFSKRWQPSLQKIESVSGEPLQEGSVSHLYYEDNGREMTLVETVTLNKLPEEFAAVYETPSVLNTNVSHFYVLGENQTRWVMENEFNFRGFMRIMAIFIRGSLPKRTQKDMELFKSAAEAIS